MEEGRNLRGVSPWKGPTDGEAHRFDFNGRLLRSPRFKRLHREADTWQDIAAEELALLGNRTDRGCGAKIDDAAGGGASWLTYG